MGENSKIEWTDHTVNFWWGCLKVSPGCEHCYAETLSKRWGYDIWGPAKTTDRRRTKSPWKDILRWDRKAGREGRRIRVFCQSMSDFFEDHPQCNEWRPEAMDILESLQHADVQLLTKRPENVSRMCPNSWLLDWPAHIWIGTSIENRETAIERIDVLTSIPAKIRFLSIEPLIEPVLLDMLHEKKIHWIIVGGESGRKARPMHPIWANTLVKLCLQWSIPIFFKQWGEWGPVGILGNEEQHWIAKVNGWKRPDDTWLDLAGRIVSEDEGSDNIRYPIAVMKRLGKNKSGRLLYGRDWSEFP